MLTAVPPRAEHAPARDRRAISDALNFLSPDERDSFYSWRAKNGVAGDTPFNLAGQPVPVLRYARWRIVETGARHMLSEDALAAVHDILGRRERGLREHYFLLGADIAVFHDEGVDQSTGHVVVIRPEVMALFVREYFPGTKITPALQRLMTCYVCGYSLSESAKRDGKSIETRKSQARELRQRLGLEKADDVPRIVGARLNAAINAMLNGRLERNSAAFERYVARYLPRAVRPLVLLDGDNRPVRILDMGPLNGTPLVVLHAMIPPDIRQKDIALLDELGLRLLWPLRNGLLAPDDPTLSEADQIAHACRSIDLVRHVFCGDKVQVLSLAASSKVALAYARAHRADIRALFFGAACVLNGRPQGGARRLAKGMMALADRSPALMNATMHYFQRLILTPKRFPKFIRGQFQASRADSLVVENELRGPSGGERFREALIQSVPSARHDFGFQRALDWEVARALGVEMHFLHGDDDAIHPLPLIKALAHDLPNARLHVIKQAGQLLYHEHLRSLLNPIAARLKP